MSFLYDEGLEKICPYFTSITDMKPDCRRNACHAFELKREYHDLGVDGLVIFGVSYCHALKKDLDVEKIEEEGSEPNEIE
jgi:hypothetical protein